MNDARLYKDCGCIGHEGPHWLHMAAIDRDRIQRDVQRAVDADNGPLIRYMAGEEARRLAEVAKHLQRVGFSETEVLPDEVREVLKLDIDFAKEVS